MGTNLKFYKPNKINAAQSFSFTSASATLKQYIFDDNRNTQLISIGSDDITDEEWIVTFGSSVTLDAIFVDNHNIKAGNIQYSDDSQVSWKDFSSAIAWSGNSNTVDFFEFTQVSGITDLRLTMQTTIVVDAQKVVGQLRALELIGEMVRNPSSYKITNVKAAARNKSQKGRLVKTTFGFSVMIRSTWNKITATDMDLLESLDVDYESFYIYPCGGQSTYTERGWRVRDLYLVSIDNDFSPDLNGNLLGINENIMLIFREA